MTAQEIFDQLAAPFPLELIEWRVGSTTKDKTKGMALAYIDARAAMDRFDTVCGMEGWECNYTAMAPDSVVCNIGVHIPALGKCWVWKSNGAGKTDFEGEKGMYSDAFKRAAVMFGVGRHLYDFEAPWVLLENDGRKIVKTELPTLHEAYVKHSQRTGWGPPGEVAIVKLLNHAINTFVTDSASAQDFKKANEGMIAQLRVGPRRLFLEKLDRIGATGEAA